MFSIYIQKELFSNLSVIILLDFVHGCTYRNDTQIDSLTEEDLRITCDGSPKTPEGKTRI